jgi:hypothetical protein
VPFALLTDFGTGSIYVGQLKGVLAALAPGHAVVDLTHEIEPQAVDEAAFLLARTFEVFPPATIFLCVVDPGVGSAREILIVEGSERRFVAPDNGLLALAIERLVEPRAFRVGAAHYHGASATFHGRDVIAPVAARLAGGTPPEALGEPVAPGDLAPSPVARPRAEAGGRRIRGRVAHIDRFGDLVTDVDANGRRLPARVRVGGHEVARAARTYADVEPGTVFTYTGSFGTVEVAARNGSAASALGVRRGVEVEVEFAFAEERRG